MRPRLRAALIEGGVPICQKCGYDLRGAASDVCPECGAAIDENVRALIHAGEAQDDSTV